MDIPFTVEEFFGVFEAYNTAVAPMHVVAYFLGVAAVVAALIRARLADRTAAGVMGFFWLWMGVAYHWLQFARVNRAAYAFGILFVAQGALLLWAGGLRGRLRFGAPQGACGWLGVVFLAYAMLVYPVLGHLAGHVYPRAPWFGTAPCPTTIFTFGLLLWTTRRVPKGLLVIPFLWSLVGFSAAAQLGVTQDYGLVVAGVAGTAALVLRDRAWGRGGEETPG
ncbi:MAG: DUF6064 family protein [Candidatus Brocadiia bacterium]